MHHILYPIPINSLSNILLPSNLYLKFPMKPETRYFCGKGNLQLSARYIYHYRLSFIDFVPCFPQVNVCSQESEIYSHSIPIIFVMYQAMKPQGKFFNNNLTMFCVKKCIYDTWRRMSLATGIHRRKVSPVISHPLANKIKTAEYNNFPWRKW